MFKLRRYLRGHYLECVLAPTFKGLEAILQLIAPLVMAQIIDFGIANRDAGFVVSHGAVLAAIALVCYVVAIVAQYYSSKLASHFGTGLRSDLFRHVLSLPREDVDALGRASLVTRITNDTQQAQDGLNMFFRLILRIPFILVGSVVSAFLVDGWEAACLLVASLAATALILAFMRVTTGRYRKIQQGLDEVTLKTAENLEGARVLRAFCQEGAEKDTFSQVAGGVRDIQVGTGDISGVVNPLTYAVVNFGLIALLWVGGLQVDVGGLTQGQLVALVSYVSQALIELLKLTNLITMLSKASACARRINDVFATVPSQADGTAEAPSPVEGTPAVELDDVSFAYPGTSGDSLSHVSLKVMPGATLGVIGGTGAGKSTLAALLMRFYDATGGTVRVNGADVRTVTRQSLRRQVGIVEQNPQLFGGTIASNLRWGAQDEGLGSRVEQFGHNYSGGQRQRLAIARTLVRRPSVLILDDAASALDFATDAALRRAIRRDCAGTCVVTISQRVAAVRSCDQILVLDGGAVAGLGTHEELLAGCEVYKEICESQLTSEEAGR